MSPPPSPPPRDPFSFDEDEGERTVIRPAAPIRENGGRDAFDRDDFGGRELGRDSFSRDFGPEDPTLTGAETAAANPFAPPAPPSKRTAQRKAAAPAPGKAVSTAPIVAVGPNPLIAAGARLIALANALRAETRYDDIGRLRQEVVEELRGFQATARDDGAAEEEVRYGHYALCALLDEVILSTPWGAKSAWARQSLVATFHNEVVSGDRMFEIAEALEQRPNRAPNLLELIYLCLSFGFEGRMRLDRQGASRLFAMRERIYGAIRNRRGAYERALSPQWRGEDAAYQPLARQIPLWVYGAAFAVLAVLIYAAFLLALSAAAARAVKPLEGLYAAGPARLNRSAPPPPSDTRLYQTVIGILKPDIDAGRVAVTDTPDTVVVRLKDKGLFASGSADLDAGYDDTSRRVAQAIGLTVGDVPVTGHTDNQPVRSLRFASNQALSEARAQTVVDKLVADGVPKDRLKPSGVGETQPVADDTTDAGRRQNRRVEVAIPKTYAPTAGAARIM